jgi:hypothetical protein
LNKLTFLNADGKVVLKTGRDALYGEVEETFEVPVEPYQKIMFVRFCQQEDPTRGPNLYDF